MTVHPDISPSVQFTVVREQGRITDITTTSPWVAHFLNLLQVSRSYHTWVNYAYDLKTFFEVIPKPPELIDRRDCVKFVQHQQQNGLSDTTINRRLAALSSLFDELQLLAPDQFRQNPIQPQPSPHGSSSRLQGLYRRQPQRIPHILTDEALQAFFTALPTWRDRTLMLLMWISCLRVGEVVAIQFEDIECSRRSIRVPIAKGNLPRTVFMDALTFETLSRYLDEERRNLFPAVPAVFIAFKGTARGGPLTVNAVQHLFRYYAQQCNLPDVHPHAFRHTGITQLAQQKMPEPALREFVGHRHPASLLPYLHLSDTFVETEFQQAQSALSSLHQLALSTSGGGP